MLVVAVPRPVFAALRDDTSESADDRAEPVLLVVLLAGMALALASGAASSYHGVDLAAWLFIAGGITGAAWYWLFGAVLYGAVRALGSHGSYRRARHVLAFACVPLALSLVVAPAGRSLFVWLWLAFVAWSAVLLVTGVRAVHAWSWPRALAAAVAPAVAAAALVAL